MYYFILTTRIVQNLDLKIKRAFTWVNVTHDKACLQIKTVAQSPGELQSIEQYLLKPSCCSFACHTTKREVTRNVRLKINETADLDSNLVIGEFV